MKYTTTVLLLLMGTLIQAIDEGCDVEINGISVSSQPLYLINGKDVQFPSNHNGRMILNHAEAIELYCPQYEYPKNESGSLVLTCNSGMLFYNAANNCSYNITKIMCSEPIKAVTRKNFLVENDMYKVGFETEAPYRFIKLMDIKFDFISKATRYVQHTILPGSFVTTCKDNRPQFEADNDTFGMTTPEVNQLYRTDNEINMATTLLGNDKYISTKNFWNRGHLAACSDFVYINEQKATFTFMNIAPQWRTFNAGNWQKVEQSVKQLLQSTNSNRFDIYTGVYDILTALNSTGNPTRLYLDPKIPIIPVPKFFYKVVINPATSQGIVLIGVNDVYLKPNITPVKDYTICTNIIHRVTWLKLSNAKIDDGYSYACEVPEFTKLFPDLLPKLTVTSLLL